MPRILSMSLLISCAAATWLIAAPSSVGMVQRFNQFWQHTRVVTKPLISGSLDGRSNTNQERLLAIEPYEDLDYGFKVAIPVGWRKIVAADASRQASSSGSGNPESDQESVSAAPPLSLEPGYAVGFESVQQNLHDRFADYILIEVLPGGESGRFEADRSLRRPVTIDDRDTWFDRIEIDQASSGLNDVDLVVYQAELSGVGYTIGLYAIGEPVRELLLAMAFEVMLQTFTIIRDPFTVS